MFIMSIHSFIRPNELLHPSLVWISPGSQIYEILQTSIDNLCSWRLSNKSIVTADDEYPNLMLATNVNVQVIMKAQHSLPLNENQARIDELMNRFL